jgi:hypothetical protein
LEEEKKKNNNRNGHGKDDFLFELDTRTFEWKGCKFVIRELEHRQIVEADEEANEWMKRDPTLREREARNYCIMSRSIVTPHIAPQDLRRAKLSIVSKINELVNELNGFLPQTPTKKQPTSQDGLSSAKVSSEPQKNYEAGAAP